MFLIELHVVGLFLHRPDTAARKSGQLLRQPASKPIYFMLNLPKVRYYDTAGDWICGDLTFRTGSKTRGSLSIS